MEIVESDELAIITTYYNFCGYKSVKNNLGTFLYYISRPNVFIAELAMGKEPFYLWRNEDKQVFQFRTDSYLWYKENLLNILIKNLPEKYKYVAWIDADLIFENYQWVQDTIKALQEYPVVQLFSKLIRQDRRGYPNVVCSSVPYWLKYKDSEEVSPMVPGGAWAARREILDKHGLIDNHIIGGSDSFFLFGLYGWWQDRLLKNEIYPKEMIDDYLNWAVPLHEEIKGKVGYIPGTIKHLWHGERNNRAYDQRRHLLKAYNFNPATDIVYREDGLMEWKEPGNELEMAIKNYFFSRKEDG